MKIRKNYFLYNLNRNERDILLNILEIPFEKLGIYQHGVIKTTEIVFSNEVRKMCEDNVCRRYGKTWACPPAVGTVEECKNRCLKYDSALVFNARYELEDSFDFEGMTDGLKSFKSVSDRLGEYVSERLEDFLLLSNEGCLRCSECTYPDKPCRFPNKLYPSIEGFGIFVNLIAQSANVNYINGSNTVTYFGALLF